MNTAEPFSKALRAERKRAGLSLRQLAEAAGCNPGYLSRLESGQITPKPPNLVAIADGLARAHGGDTAPALMAVLTRLGTAADSLSESRAAVANLKSAFANRLGEAGLDPDHIDDALRSVPVARMRGVLSGTEPLEIRRATAAEMDATLSSARPDVVVLGPRDEIIAAGPSAKITVTTKLTASQRKQINLVAQLLETIIARPEVAR